MVFKNKLLNTITFSCEGESAMVAVEVNRTNSSSTIDSEGKEFRHGDIHRSIGDFDLICIFVNKANVTLFSISIDNTPPEHHLPQQPKVGW